jgi:hypothetical protein
MVMDPKEVKKEKQANKSSGKSIEELMDEIAAEKSGNGKNNGVVLRLRTHLEGMFAVKAKRGEKAELLFSDWSDLVEKLEGKKIEYSVLDYVIVRSRFKADYRKEKRNGSNWIVLVRK